MKPAATSSFVIPAPSATFARIAASSCCTSGLFSTSRPALSDSL